MFIVAHYLEPDSYVTCRNEFGVTFAVAPVPNKSTICRLVRRLRDAGSV
jgi:hypothetical protein